MKRESSQFLCLILLAFACVVFLAGIMPAVAQQNDIRVGPSVNVSSDSPTVPLGETWLAANPRDSRNMIAVSMAFPKDGPWASVMYYTTDAGRSWTRAAHGPGHEAHFWGADPVVAFGPDGTAYYSDLEWGSIGNAPFNDSRSSAGSELAVYVYRSVDGGKTWNAPVLLDGDDHSCLAFDNSHGKYNERVYIAYTTPMYSAQGKRVQAIGFAYSDDDGMTYKQRVFSPPDVSFRNRIRVGPSPTDLVVAPDGTVVLAYVYYLAPDPPGSDPDKTILETWVMTSADGGRTFSDPHRAVSSAFQTGEKAKTKENKFDYWPRMAIDASNGPNRGRLYLTNEEVSKSRVRITILNSNDMGQTWAPAVQVNDDQTEADQNTPGIAVSDDGVLGVSWYDRRNDPKNVCFQEYFSASLDGGVTFLPNVVVREPASCTLRLGNWQPNISQSADGSRGAYNVVLSSPGLRFMNAGETQGIVALSGNKFQLAWINGESGTMQLSSTAVDVLARPLGMDIGDLLEVRTSLPTLDVGAHTVSVQVLVTNRSSRAMVLPLKLVLSRIDSFLDGLKAVNSGNHLSGIGASWNLAASSGNKTILAPHETATQIILKFEFNKVPEDKLPDIGFAASLDVEFHVFESQH